jgi:hypothetical protein
MELKPSWRELQYTCMAADVLYVFEPVPEVVLVDDNVVAETDGPDPELMDVDVYFVLWVLAGGSRQERTQSGRMDRVLLMLFRTLSESFAWAAALPIPRRLTNTGSNILNIPASFSKIYVSQKTIESLVIPSLTLTRTCHYTREEAIHHYQALHY